MIGIGLVIVAWGYAVVYWGIQSIQGKSQGNFMSYVFPFGNGMNALGVHTDGSNAKPPAGALGPVTAADLKKLPNKTRQAVTPNKTVGGRQ